MFLIKVCKKLTEYKIPYAVVGGHAVSLHGAVRGTIDIDFVINWNKKNLIKCEKALRELRLVSRIPVDAETIFNFKDDYINNKNLIAWNFYNPVNLTEQIDIILTYDLKAKKTIVKKIQGINVIVLAKNELIKMKAISAREQDLLDIEALKKL